MELEPSRRLSQASLVAMAVLAVICVLAPLVSVWGYLGPYAWISSFQAETFGRVYARSTSFLLLVSAIPVTFLFFLGLGQLGVWRDQEGKAWLFPWDRDPFWADRAREWAKLHVYSIALGTVALLLFMLSLGEAGLAITFRQHDSFEAQLAEIGQPPKAKWLRAFGHPLVDKSVKVSDGKTGSLEDRYVPIVSREWTIAKPIGVFLKVTTRDFEALRDRFTSTNYEGLRFRPGLPPPVRVELQRNELSVVADPVVVDWEKSPSAHAWAGALESLFAVFFAGTAVFLWRSRRSPAALQSSADVRAA